MTGEATGAGLLAFGLLAFGGLKSGWPGSRSWPTLKRADSETGRL